MYTLRERLAHNQQVNYSSGSVHRQKDQQNKIVLTVVDHMMITTVNTKMKTPPSWSLETSHNKVIVLTLKHFMLTLNAT